MPEYRLLLLTLMMRSDLPSAVLPFVSMGPFLKCDFDAKKRLALEFHRKSGAGNPFAL